MTRSPYTSNHYLLHRDDSSSVKMSGLSWGQSTKSKTQGQAIQMSKQNTFYSYSIVTPT